jgi:NADPH:quinone reductase
MTAHFLIKSVYPVQRGDTVLLHAGAVEVLDYLDEPQEFGAKIRELTDGNGVVAVYDGVGKSTFEASLASLAIRVTLALFGAASGPVPPFDPQRLNAAGSVYLNRPSRIHFIRTRHQERGASAPRSSGPQDRRLGSANALAIR